MRYFDTSFLVPLILPEATSEHVSGFLEALEGDDLAVSHWTRVEFASLLAREVRMGGLDIGTARQAPVGRIAPRRPRTAIRGRP